MMPTAGRIGAPHVAVIAGTPMLVAPAALLTGWSGAVLLLFLALVGVFSLNHGVGVAFIAATIPFDQMLSIDLSGPAVSIPHLGAWALIVAAAPRMLHRRAVRFDRAAALWLLVVIAMVASIGAPTVEVDRWITAVARWLLPAGVYLLLRSLRLEIEQVQAVLAGVSAGVLASSAVAAWQLLTETGPESYIVGGLLRVYGPFDHPNQFGAWLALVVPLLASALVLGGESWNRPVRLLVAAAAAAGTVSLALTQSRASQLAFAAAMVVVFAFASRRLQRWLVVAVAALLLLTFATGSLAGIPGINRYANIAMSPGERVQVTSSTWGQEERKAHWGAARSMLESEPVTGVGAGGFEAMYREHTPNWRFRIPRGHAHNGFLHLGAEAGWPGLLAFAAFVIGALVLLARRIRVVPPGPPLAVAVGALAAMVAFGTASLFEYLTFAAFMVQVALVLALGMSIRRAGSQGEAI